MTPPETRPILVIVEDSGPTYRALRALLRQDFDCRHSVDLAGAMAILDAIPLPAAILLDLMLPDGSGVEVLRRVRAGRLPVRVVIATGTTDRALLDEARSFAPDALLMKPCCHDELMAALVPPGGPR